MTNKIKILYIHHAAGWGGATINMINIINCLDKKAFDIKVLLIKNSVVAEKLKEYNINYEIAESTFYKKHYIYFTHSEAGYTKWYQVFEFLKLSILWLLSRFFFAQRELAKHDYDIVHLNSSVLTDWLAPAKKRGKVIIHIQEPFRKGKFDILRPVFQSQMRKYADHIIAISYDNAKRIGLPEKTTVVYNFEEQKQNSYATTSSKGKVLYVGGNQKIKGFFTVVDALDYLDDEIKIVFCGNYCLGNTREKALIGKIKKAAKNLQPFHKKLRRATEKIMKHPRAEFVGLVYDISPLILRTEFLISPFSKPHFSRPVIEAFFSKKCVISSDVEGMDEIFDHNENGLIVQKNNPQKLAKAINYLHANPDIRKKMGTNGYLKACEKYSVKNIDSIKNIYEALA